TGGCTREARLADRRVDDALRSEVVEEAVRHLERAAVHADVLADHEDALVALHLLPERLADRLQHGDRATFLRIAHVLRLLAHCHALLCGRHAHALRGSGVPPRVHGCGTNQPAVTSASALSGSGIGDASASSRAISSSAAIRALIASSSSCGAWPCSSSVRS